MARGLSTAELKSIRDTLATGRRPRVVFTESAGQIAGQTGQVTKLTDPGLSDEWVVVRFGNDELPFSPNDLAVPARSPKAPAGKRTEPAARVTEPAAEFKVVREMPGQREASRGDGHAGEPAAARAGAPAANGTAVQTATSTTAATGTAPGAGRSAPSPAAGGDQAGGDQPVTGRPARKATGRGKAKPIPGLTVTVSYAGGEWTVAASQGSKVLAKPYLIKATEALRMVALLDVPGVHEAVEQIVAAERSEAEEQAQRLRAELARIEQRLAELREAD